MKNSFSENISRKLSSRSSRAKYFKLSQRNIYIIPTSSGFVFLGLLLLMLLTAVNYQNSLIYLFTFFLSAVFFISIWICFLNLSGLEVSNVEQGRCFEGELTPYQLRFSRLEQAPSSLWVGLNQQSLSYVPFHTTVNNDFTLICQPSPRGIHRIDRLRLESRFPFGFIIAWTWLKLDATVLIYPKPEYHPRSEGSEGGDTKHKDVQLSDDFNDFKRYQHGDPASRIVWKKFASKDELIVRDPELAGLDPRWLRWTDYHTGDTEAKLRHLCYEVCALTKNQQVFGFDIPGTLIPFGQGEAHQIKCLEALAMFQIDRSRSLL